MNPLILWQKNGQSKCETNATKTDECSVNNIKIIHNHAKGTTFSSTKVLIAKPKKKNLFVYS